MDIKFYFHKSSPPSQMVWMTLKALNLKCEKKVVDLMAGEHKSPEYLAINPRGKVPCIKDGDCGNPISESRAISAFLCNKYEKGKDSTRLYPTEPHARALVDQMLYVSENMEEIFESYVNFVGVVIVGNGEPNEDKIPEVRKALALYEGYLSNNTYMAGDHLTLADFYMEMPLHMLPMPGYDDFKDFPKTAAWMAKIKALPYYNDCNKAGVEELTNWYKAGLARPKA